MRKITWESLVLGTMLMLLGGNIAIHGDFYSSKYERVIEFKGNHISIGLLMALLGLGFVITSFKKRKVDPEESCNYICPNCEGVLTARSMLPPTCPKCGVKAEVLTGFYDKHPELFPRQEEAIKKEGLRGRS